MQWTVFRHRADTVAVRTSSYEVLLELKLPHLSEGTFLSPSLYVSNALPFLTSSLLYTSHSEFYLLVVPSADTQTRPVFL